MSTSGGPSGPARGEPWGLPPWGPWRIVHFVVRGWFVRLAATVSILLAAFIGTVLYLAFWAGQFAWYQDLAVVLVVGALSVATIVGVWIAWAMKIRRRFAGPWMQGW